MRSNKNRLSEAKLYLILDAQVCSYAKLLSVLKLTVPLGVDIVQLRDKFGTAKDILDFCRHALRITRHQVPFIVNDRVDLAQLAGADGVHVGQDDVSIKDARRILGARALVGTSCQTWAQARRAEKDGADYIGFGSVFKTKTKPERNPMDLKLLQTVLKKISVPVFAIGGIDSGNVKALTDIGVARVAVCRDILLANEPGMVVERFKRNL